MALRLILAALLLLAGTAPAFAAQNLLLDQSETRWKTGDKCITDSIAKYPDHDEQSLKSRDSFVDQCLAEHHLPPRPHIAPGN